MPQSFAALYVHVIFSTKNRATLITDAWVGRLYSYLGGIIRNETGALLGIGGMPDHLHLLVSLGRVTSVAELVGLVKANSSKWIHETFPELASFAWQAGYGAFSVSQSQLEVVRQYINTQAEHHRQTTFQEEYRAFLRKHGIEWDERYVWD
jgi:REP element-mobilizing transposase RayT